MRRKTIYLLLTVVLLATVAFFAYRASDEGTEMAELPVADVERRTIDVVAEAAGLVEPVRVVEVKSNASGEVLEVAAETGDRVEQGALLARIDPRDVHSAYEQAAADLESVRVRRTTAEAERQRTKRLLDEGLVAEQEYDRTVEAAAAARAAMVRAETVLRLAREKSEDVVIRAPIAGTLLERAVEPGQIIASATSNVSGGTTLFLMADLSTMQVRTRVDEVDIGRVSVGQPAEVTVEAFPGRVFEGEVAKIEPQAVVEQNVTLFPVLVRLDNSEGLLRPGMNAEATLEIAHRPDVLSVPSAAVLSLRDAPAAAEALGLDPAALRQGGGKRTAAPGARPGGAGQRPARPAQPGTGTRPAVVFVEGPQGPEPRRVLLGLSDWEHTEVVQGLEAGERVVLVSVAQLQRQQQEMSDRIRQRMSGPMGSAGGSGRGGRR